jgi:hypothetical protein
VRLSDLLARRAPWTTVAALLITACVLALLVASPSP